MKSLAFDKVDELYNTWLKKAPPILYLSIVVEHSAHTMLERYCAKEIFNLKTALNKMKGVSIVHVIMRLEGVLSKADIFTSTKEFNMDNDYFLEFCEEA